MFRNLRKFSNYGMELPEHTHAHTHTHTQLAYIPVCFTNNLPLFYIQSVHANIQKEKCLGHK
jgi:hypothetical protein